MHKNYAYSMHLAEPLWRLRLLHTLNILGIGRGMGQRD